MWNKAIALHPEAPVFTHDLYYELKEQGLAMDEFLQNQLQTIKKKMPEAHDLGFVLDMLAFHCTANNTSAARTEKELLDHYPFAIDAAKNVLTACKDSFLITDLGGNEHSSMLAHDTLAKSVVKAQQRSTQPIQQGKRILSSRIEAIKAGSEFATMDSWELKLIEKIQTYLPAFDEGEKKLFDSSRKEIDKQERQRRRIVNSRRTIIALSILSGIVAWYLFAQSKRHEKASFVSLMTVSSGMNIVKDPTLAIRQALSGLEKDSTSIELKKMLLTTYYHTDKFKLAWYKTIYHSNDQFTDLKYNAQTGMMIPFYQSDTLVIINSDGKLNGILVAKSDSNHIKDNKNYFINARWGRDGQNIIAQDYNRSLYFFDNKGKLLKKISQCFSFDYNDSTNKVIYSRLGDVYILDILGNQIDSITFSQGNNYFDNLNFIGDGNYILSSNKEIVLLNLVNKKTNKRVWPISGFYVSRSNNLFAIIDPDLNDQGFNTYVVWNVNGDSITKVSERSNKEIIFHPAGNKFLIYGKNNVESFDIPNRADFKIIQHDKEVKVAKFSPKGDFILTGSEDNTGRISNLNGSVENILQGHTQAVTAIELDQNQTRAITASLDGSVKTWDFPDFKHVSFKKYNGNMDQIISDPSGNFLLIPGATKGQNDVFDLRTGSTTVWKTPMVQNRHYSSWRFLDSIHIIAGSMHQLHLYIRDRDSIINLSKTKINLFPNGDDVMTNKEGEIVFRNVGVLNNQIVAISPDSIRYWSLDGIFQKAEALQNGKVNSLRGSCFSQDHSLMTIVFYKEDINGVNVYTSKGNKFHFDSKINDITALKFSNKGDRLAILALDGSIDMYFLNKQTSTFTQRKDCTPQNGNCFILDFHFSQDDAQMITYANDGLIRIFDSIGILINSFQCNMTPIDANFTPDGKLIYSYDADTTLKLWDLQGNLIYTYNGHRAFFTKDGNRLFTIKNHSIEENKTSLHPELREYLTPQGAYHYFKSNNTFSTKKDNSLHSKWHRLLEWLGLE